jgi:hypothetical protein
VLQKCSLFFLLTPNIYYLTDFLRAGDLGVAYLDGPGQSLTYSLCHRGLKSFQGLRMENLLSSYPCSLAGAIPYRLLV